MNSLRQRRDILIINHIHIISFGKFNDLKLDFNEGFNVIYGLNEAGKSTIHAFIEGMFYGFIDSSKNRKTYLPAYDKYFNDTLGVYGGYITFTLNDGTYSLFRNIKKNVRKDALILTIEKTGKDITNTLDTDAVSKQPDIAKFINLPYTLYRNTLSVAQLSAKTDHEASDELISRLQNLSTAKSESISAKKALDALQKAHDAIGSDQARTKPYRLLQDEIIALNEEREDAIKRIESVQDLTINLDRLEREIKVSEATINDLTHRYKLRQNTLNLARFQEAASLHESLESKKASLDDLAPYKHFDSRDYDTYLTVTSKLESLLDQINQLKPLIKSKENHIEKTYENVPNPKGFDLIAMQTDQAMLIQDDEALKELDQKALLKTKDKLSKVIQPKGIKKVFKGLFILLTLGLYLIRIKNAKRLMNDINLSLTKLDKRQAILSHYDVLDLDGFNQVYEKERISQNALKDYERLNSELSTYKDQLNHALERLNDYQTTLKIIHDRYHVTNFEALKTFKEKASAYASLSESIRYNEETLTRLLKGDSLEGLKNKVDETLEENLEPLETLNQKLLDEKDTLQNKKERYAMIKVEIKEKLASTRSVEAIEYDLSLKEDELANLSDQRDTILQAETMIKQAVEQIEHQFAPVLNKTIQAYLSPITLNKYKSIKVSKDLTFTLESPESMKKEKETFFSSGTLDQIYLSIRLGIIHLLNQADKPLLLDDVFTNTDETRLKEALTLLTKDLKRQVLLFTCHKREIDVLKTLKQKINLITL
jgi:chromosome segregation ATPase